MFQVLDKAWWAVLAYGIAFKYIVCELLGRKTGKFKRLLDKEIPKQEGKVAVVTGGSRGIGLEIVENLLKSGYTVIIGSSSSHQSCQNLQSNLKNKYPSRQVEVWPLDLASQKSVVQFADKFISTHLPLHLLVCNAGIMFVEEEITEDGFEKHFAVNYLSHCLLTFLLLPSLSKSASSTEKSRIVNCTSCIHYVGTLDLKNAVQKKYYSKYRAYIESKLAQVVFTYALQSYLVKENINVTVNSVHPGVVFTELMAKELLFPGLGSKVLKTAKEGAETATYVAVSPEMEGIGGKYFEECRPVESSKTSRDICLQKELWEKTLLYLKPHIKEKYILDL